MKTANDGAVLAHASGGCGHDICADEQHEWTADRRTTTRQRARAYSQAAPVRRWDARLGGMGKTGAQGSVMQKRESAMSPRMGGAETGKVGMTRAGSAMRAGDVRVTVHQHRAPPALTKSLTR